MKLSELSVCVDDKLEPMMVSKNTMKNLLSNISHTHTHTQSFGFVDFGSFLFVFLVPIFPNFLVDRFYFPIFMFINGRCIYLYIGLNVGNQSFSIALCMSFSFEQTNNQIKRSMMMMMKLTFKTKI